VVFKTRVIEINICRSGVNMYEYFTIHIYMHTYTHGVYVQDIEERVDR